MTNFLAMRLAGILGLSLLAAGATAGDLTANASVTTNYVFRGFTQSDDGLAVQGGIDYTPKSGFYAGTWASTVDFPTTGSSVEVDLYLGYNVKLDNDWGLDVGYITYEYTDSAIDANRELFIGANYKGFRLYYYHGNDTGSGVNDIDYSYLDFKVKVELPQQVFFLGHIGHKEPDSGSGVNDVSLGVSKEFKELWDLDLALTLTSEDLTDNEEFFLTATKRFDIK